jgi:hypothetical protein
MIPSRWTIAACLLLAACGRGDRPSAAASGSSAPPAGSAEPAPPRLGGRVEPKGEGGTLIVDGRDANGRAVHLAVECSRFTEPVAEGG